MIDESKVLGRLPKGETATAITASGDKLIVSTASGKVYEIERERPPMNWYYGIPDRARATRR